MINNKCIIILSNKSSGSSACQNLLAKTVKIQYITKTRHFENETLYWTKAASILGLPQKKMIDSEVPIEQKKAKANLVALLRDNLKNYSPPIGDKELIFGGWKLLCEKYYPIFIEKSPHHLYQWSALELIIKCMELLDDIDFLLIGLVRNPMDTLYSAFRRWKTSPEKLQYEWLVAYQNLLRLQEVVGDKLVIVRYEDIVSSVNFMKPIFDFCDIQISDVDHEYLHQRSIQKWRNDKFFGFTLLDEVIDLAQSYGYEKDQLLNKSNMLWPIFRDGSRAAYKTKEKLKGSLGFCRTEPLRIGRI